MFWSGLNWIKKNNEDGDNSLEEEKLEDIYLSKKLSEHGKFVYARICAEVLKRLFYSDHPGFCEESLEKICNNLTLSLEDEARIKKKLRKKYKNPFQSLSDLNNELIIKKNRKIIIQDLINIAIMDAEYDARWRHFIRNMIKVFDIKEDIEIIEEAVTDFIIREKKQISLQELRELDKIKKRERNKRFALISLASIGGGALVGLTGGLAAPAIVEAVGAVAGYLSIGTGAVSALSSFTGTVFIGSLFGSSGASIIAHKMTKRVGDIVEFSFGQLKENGIVKSDGIPIIDKPLLNSTLAISGWIDENKKDGNSFSLPWKGLSLSREQYFLIYESEHLLELGQFMKSFNPFLNTLVKMSSFIALKKNLLLPSSALSLTSLIDLPWSVSCEKAVYVGKHLAHVLLSREHGRRPITLIGYSIGARVIYYCLMELLEREDSVGIIEDVYIIGGPCPADPSKWSQFMKIVSGNLVNAYSKKDEMLKSLYRILSIPAGGVAGIKCVEISHTRFLNIDLSNIISNHKDYPKKLNSVYSELGIRSSYERFTDYQLNQPSTSFSHF